MPRGPDNRSTGSASESKQGNEQRRDHSHQRYCGRGHGMVYGNDMSFLETETFAVVHQSLEMT